MAGNSNSFTDLLGSPSSATAPGNSASFRIPGTVYYGPGSSTLTGKTQTVQARWYTDLSVSSTGSYSQTLSEAVYVGGNYFVGPSSTSASRIYVGNFFYDGLGSQTITGGEGYQRLNITSGSSTSTKQILAGVSVNAGTFNLGSDNTGTFSVLGSLATSGTAHFYNGSGSFLVGNTTNAGTFSLGNNAQALIQNTNFNIVNGILAAGTSASVNASSFTNIALASNGAVSFGNDALFRVSGSYSNANTSRSNTDFAASSTMWYDQNNASASQTVVSTSWGKPYGNLYVSNTSTKVADGNVYIAGGFVASGGDLDMFAGINGSSTNNTFTVLDPSKTISYTGMTEVVGKFRYSNSITSLTAGTTYAFNNGGTSASFGAGGTPTTFFEVSARGGVNPNQFSSTFDINRKVTISYDGSPTWTMQAGYKRSETGVSSSLGGTGTWDQSYTEDMIRMYEANSSSFEKMATSRSYTRVTSGASNTAWGTVSLPGFANTLATVDGIGDRFFQSGNDLVFRSGPSFFTSVQKGRWSNPETWDEGVEPSSIDQVLIRHNIWAGFARPGDNNFNEDEKSPTAMAANITIDENYQGASLILGGSGTISSWGMNSATAIPGVTNPGNVTVKAPNINSILLDNTVTLASLQGPSGTNQSEDRYGGFYILPTYSFTTAKNFNIQGGILANYGTINIGK
jgi:hypothetical protein